MRETPLHDEIDRATEAHPAVTSAPPILRLPRMAAMIAAAGAMADFASVDFDDVSYAQRIAPQLVDDAAISLHLHFDRTVPVDLDGHVDHHHVEICTILCDLAGGREFGLDDPHSIARMESAITRAFLSRHGDSGHPSEMLVEMASVLISRGCNPRDLDDTEMLETAEDLHDRRTARNAE